MRHFDYVLFDLDGTLLDTREGVLSAAIYTMRKYNRDIPDKVTLESMIGPPIQISFQKLYGLSDESAMEMSNVFREAYMMEKYLFNAIPYNGIYDLFDNLLKRGTRIGIATYKREDYAIRLLCKKGFNYYTNYMYGADFDGKLTKADIIRKCLSGMGCSELSKAVYIGDGPSDGKGADEVGVCFIAVTYGFGFKTAEDTLRFKPVAIADSCKQLKNILL